jgi:epoxyqueuosine reductase
LNGEEHELPLASRVKELGAVVGFNEVRIAGAEPFIEERERYLEWLGAGRQANMQWMTRERAVRSTDPSAVLPGAKSIIAVALRYWQGARPYRPTNHGTVARYAWGRDYHAVLQERMAAFVGELRAAFGGEYRSYVDTGPLMDKAIAARSGLGWYGKNTNILTEGAGSWVLLGEILTTLDLVPDGAIRRTCGNCSLCTVACPTGALGPDYSIDSARCISYLTIEHRGSIPRELRDNMQSWVFGCDICQDVCPPSMEPHLASAESRRAWAHDVKQTLQGRESTEMEAIDENPSSLDHGPLYEQGVRPHVDLIWLLRLTHTEYLDAFRGSSIRRAKVWMLRRNAAVALGNVGTGEALGPLLTAVQTDDYPLVRSHAAWAIGRLAERAVCPLPRGPLESALAREEDADVRAELESALSASPQA